MTPSPHTTCGQTHFCPGTQVQLAPITLQFDEQPSPSVMLPSSHTSPWWLMPSPQPGGTGNVPPLPVVVEPPTPPMPTTPVNPVPAVPPPAPAPPVPAGWLGCTPAVQPTSPATANTVPNAKRNVGRK